MKDVATVEGARRLPIIGLLSFLTLFFLTYRSMAIACVTLYVRFLFLNVFWIIHYILRLPGKGFLDFELAASLKTSMADACAS